MKAKKRKPSTFRHIFQAAFFALTNGYVSGFQKGKIFSGQNKWLCVPGLNCYSCPGALYACPIGSLQAVLNSSGFKLSCYVFGFIMFIGALFGRLVCGFMCPFGLVQDLLYKIPFFKKMKNLPGHKYLKYLRFVVLVVFVFLLSGLVVNDAGTGKPWYCEYICPSGTLLASVPLVAMNENLQEIIGWRFFLKLAILIVTLLLSVIAFRPFCKYVCPLGAMYGVCNPISLYRYRVDESKCIKCSACQKACGMDIKVWEKPNSVECIRCGECKASCPTGAISTSLDGLRKKIVRDLPQEEVPQDKSRRAERIAPDEKKHPLNSIIGVVLIILGLACAIINGFLSFSMMINITQLDGGDFLSLAIMYGNPLLSMLAGIILIKCGNLITNNGGRLTASLRATRLLALGTVLNLIVRLIIEINSNTLTALIAMVMGIASPVLFVLLLLNCLRIENKEKTAASAKAAE